MTALTDIEAIGIELPKGREYEHLTDVECWPTTHIDEAAGAALTEAYAVIKRLVGERATLSSEYGHMTEAFKQATKGPRPARGQGKAMSDWAIPMKYLDQQDRIAELEAEVEIMTTAADIEALGIELPKTRLKEWQKLQNAHFMTKARMMRVPVLADEIIDELLAVIERLVEQAKSDETIIATLRDMEIDENERAERAEADLAAAREKNDGLLEAYNRVMEEARKWEWVAWEAIGSFMDGWFEAPDGDEWIAEALARYQPGGE